MKLFSIFFRRLRSNSYNHTMDHKHRILRDTFSDRGADYMVVTVGPAAVSTTGQGFEWIRILSIR
ncbi:MAG: hypothetical protein AMJ65_06110 [Phycisphaerae bacterium SG8_4]|nr:MAG: hypothetical protein AMJ65_06110 [Phycisphaerae bacterium SG8_4]